MTAQPALVQVEGLCVDYPVRAVGSGPRVYRAVDQVSLHILRGESVGLVGESGCGKSTTARAILSLVRPSAGHITLGGERLDSLQGEVLRRRKREVGAVFQDPYSSLDPRMSLLRIVTEPLQAHGLVTGRDAPDRARTLLRAVELPEIWTDRFPHELSGGQRQRVAIARAIAANPSLVVLDEPVSALDVTIRTQILGLLQALQKEQGLAYLFIAHDMEAVRTLCARLYVMFRGVIVEHGPVEEIFRRPRHPYTQALLAALPSGTRPTPTDSTTYMPVEPGAPQGCRFVDPCPFAADRCRSETPALRHDAGGHGVACHLAELPGEQKAGE